MQRLADDRVERWDRDNSEGSSQLQESYSDCIEFNSFLCPILLILEHGCGSQRHPNKPPVCQSSSQSLISGEINV